MLLELSHRFNLEHTLLKRKAKGENCYISTIFVSNGTFGLFQKSKWAWVVEQGTFSFMFAPSLSIIHGNKFRSFSEYHPLQETMLLPTALQPWHSFSVYFLLFFTILLQLHCLSPAFQRPRSCFPYDTASASLYFTLSPARKNLKASLARPSLKASEAI
jgi:hypothetical protein